MASNVIDVYVKLPTGRTCQFDLVGSDNIANVCNVIASQEGVDSGTVRLRYQGKYLDRNSTLSYLGVRPETILRAEILIPKEQIVLVLLPSGEESRYTVKSTDRISTLRERLAGEHATAASKTKLTLKGTPLCGSTFVEAGIGEGTTLVFSFSDGDDGACETQTKSKVSKTDAEMKTEDLEAIMTSFDARGRNVDVVFSFDTTGSMYQYLSTVRTKLQQCCTRLMQDIPNIRIGLIAHGDYCDQNTSYVIKTLDMTSDVQTLVSFADTVPSTGGGDTPECYEWTLREAQHMDWCETSAKAFIVIGDSAPHPPSYTDQAISWLTELDVLVGMGVKVYGVQAGNDSSSRPFYEELADRSGACYLPLRHLDVITDMFMAVCYRESNQEQFESFVQEVEDDGQMTDAKKEIFKKLEESPKQPKSVTQRYVSAPWWDSTLDKGEEPQFTYNENTNRWSAANYTSDFRFGRPKSRTSIRTAVTAGRSLMSKHKHPKLRCTLM